MPANIAVAVDIKLTYLKVKVGKNKYWIAKDSVKRVLGKDNYEVFKNVKGSELIGLKYKWAFDNLAATKEAAKNNKFHSVIPYSGRIVGSSSLNSCRFRTLGKDFAGMW